EVTVAGNTGTLARTGYTFSGWNTAANGSGITYPVGAELLMGDANVRLYAYWVAN
ncbi:cell wall-binding protein, partial [Candidatus Nomurabacteria bacterium]|nr:cell wall-binding protein [Candidatus Nomurabacteria bacterium]